MKISIKGKRWFNRFGNTYHSAKVSIDGKQVAHIPFEYGYGEQYIHTAKVMLERLGLIERSNQPLQLYCQEHGITFTHSVNTVKTKHSKR